MGKFTLAAALVAAVALPAGSAQSRTCYSKAEAEAEQAIIFQTDLMVASSACKDPSYVQFRARNQYAIIRYQHEMIAYFRNTGARVPARNFETWITRLANDEAMKETSEPTPEVCQQAASMFKLASMLNPKSFAQFAAARAAVDPGHPLCRK